MAHRLASRRLCTAGAAVLSLAVVGAPGTAAAAPDTCVQGYVWREASPSDHVCVTPGERSAAAQQNSQAAARKEPAGGAYGPDTCKQGFVWREAFPGDHVCVPPAERDQAAAQNAAGPQRVVKADPAPLQGPGVSWDQTPVGGLTAHIQDRSGKAAQCTYTSDWYTRSFFLPANGTYDLVIFPAVPKFQNWNVTVSCDNGTKTQTTTFF
ncbi:hypothetical protein [Mycobacterium sp. GA-2829]|uniref:hypothetical protein n=1 Tax=Mycobacterium sp. GA-2829 TaxID=1772283 RepID=UPI0007403381|nr:hypothetical protein [Mycobacterium sp. GA-2829]KUI39087.1 hypothetical protein AU194_17270 [Mycobacterium sp. GA-2829]